MKIGRGPTDTTPGIRGVGPGVILRKTRQMAAWPSGLGKGLQSPAQRFDSARRLSMAPPSAEWGFLFARAVPRDAFGVGDNSF